MSSDLPERLQAHRAEAIRLLAEIDANHGAGTAGNLSMFLSHWTAALIAFQAATPIKAPDPNPLPPGMMTTYG